MTDKEFDETRLSGILAHEIEMAASVDSEDSKRRQENIEYLRGTMSDVVPRPNGSQVTARDINDTVAWILPGIMRQFTASDRMAVYEPETPQDDEYAEQASDYANYIFWKDNDGYRILYDATYDALGVAGDGIVKHWWDDTPVEEVLYFTGLTLQQIAELEDKEDIEILSQEAGEVQQVMAPDPATGEMAPVKIETFSLKVKRICRYGTLRIETIARENLLIDSDATVLEDYRFCAHRDPNKTKSDLVEMGFDRDKVDALSSDSIWLRSNEEDARRDERAFPATALQESMQRVDLYECYIRVDVDGDGIAETVRAYYAGRGNTGDILDWEVWEDELPFSKIPCYPRSHEFVSESVADRVKDIQKLRTVFWRAINDNIVASGLPQREVEEGSVLNPDVLANPRFGSLIWKKKGANPIINHEIPFAADKMFPAMELLDAIVEKRTGVSRTMMALDPEALQNQTATASQNARDAAYSQIELIARNMAEGWRKVFKQILRLMVKHQDRSRVIRLRDDYVEIDPRVWNANMDCSINVGLGTGSRDRDMAMLNVIINAQKELTLQLAGFGFKEEAVQMLPKIAEALDNLAESAGIKSPERYFPEFKPEQLKMMIAKASQQQPSPEEMKVQAQAELEQMKANISMQLEQQKLEKQAAVEDKQAEADIAVRQQESQAQMLLAQQKFEFDRQLKMLDLWIKGMASRGPPGGTPAQGGGGSNAKANGAAPSAIPFDQLAELLNANGGSITMPMVQDAMTPPPDKTETALADVTDQVARVAQGVDALLQMENAPVELVYGQDGRVRSIVKGGVERPVVRGPDGRPVGLQ